MRLNGDVIALLDGCGNRHRTRTATDALALELPIGKLLIDKLRVMGGDVDIGWVELSQLINVGK